MQETKLYTQDLGEVEGVLFCSFCIFSIGKNTKTLGGTKHRNLDSFCTPYDTVDGRNPANKLIGMVHPFICRVLYIPGGWPNFFHQQ